MTFKRTETYINDYSQHGESEIVLRLLEKLIDRDRWCVEFGAGNGTDGSNTLMLRETYDYRAVLIEPNDIKFAEMEMIQDEDVLIHSYVETAGLNSLDSLLHDTIIPEDFDFLSIDVDGMDYAIWDSLKSYSPKIVCIEFNPTMGPRLLLAQTDSSQLMGSSIAAITALASTKGYELTAATTYNAIFVRRDLYRFITDNVENSVEGIWTDRSCVTEIFYDYTGKEYRVGSGSPWGNKGQEKIT